MNPKSLPSHPSMNRNTIHLTDLRESKNFRALCWMHAESRLLVKSPLNDTSNRASMPTRPNIPLENSVFCLSRPSNSLRVFGTLLPGSTLQSYQLSVPVPRNSKTHIRPAVIPLPPPGVTAKIALYRCPVLILAQRNYARERKVKRDAAAKLLEKQTSAIERNDPVVTDISGKTYGQRFYSPKTPESNTKTIFSSTIRRPLERAYNSRLFTSTDASTSNCPSSGQQQMHVSHRLIYPPSTADMNDAALTDQASITRFAPEVSPDEQRQSPVAPNTKSRQKRPRAPAPSVPSTRVLRSMNQVKYDNAFVPATPLNASASRVVVPSTVHREPRKESRTKQVPQSTTNASPMDVISTTSRYNLRPRKRDFGKDELGEGSKQAGHPTKRRRA
ncbi:hypothetical protein ACGC1H_001820 [Rhizoctonia solani]